MAGNSSRRGALRNPGSKKGAVVGSGGRGRRALEGRGPTPKAEDRVYHAAHKRKLAEQRRAASRPGGAQKRRRDNAEEIVAGRNSVLEVLRAGMPATALYIAAGGEKDDRITESIRLAADRGIKLLEASRLELDRLTEGAVHQGLVLIAAPYGYADFDDLVDGMGKPDTAPALFLALDSITDPRNLGAALRSAGAFGAQGVIIPERRAATITAGAWKSSAGAAARVPVAKVTNLTRSLKTLQEAGCFVIGLDAQGGVELPDVNFDLITGPLVLVVGSEGKGLGRLVRESCDQLVQIPMDSATESLNAGMAVAISLYDIARRRAGR